MGSDKKMKISVIMGAYQRAHLIDKALLSLAVQEVLPDEVIIIDDGSTDGLADIVKICQKRFHWLNIRYFYNNNPGWTICVHSMNCAIKQAKYELIMITMPEVLHATNDVKIIKEYFADPGNDKHMLIGAPLYQICGYPLLHSLTEKNFANPITITQMDCVHEWYNGYVSPDNTITYFPNGGLHHIAGIKKKHLIAIGGYDEEFLRGGAGGYDDIDLFTRLRHYGVKLVRTDKIIAIHLPHEAPPPETKDPKLVNKNYEKMVARDRLMNELEKKGIKHDEWRVNKEKEWGQLKE